MRFFRLLGEGCRFIIRAMSMSEFTMLAVGFIIWATVFGLFGWAVGRHKGRGADGAWLGILLGLLGVVIAAILPPVKTRGRPSSTLNTTGTKGPPARQRNSIRGFQPDPMEVWEAAEKAKTCIRPLPGGNRQAHAQNQTGDGEGN
jgi:hypothetical protein